MQIEVKNAGVADENTLKRKSDIYKNRKMSTKPIEIIAESFCHLFTIPGYKLLELKEFYR